MSGEPIQWRILRQSYRAFGDRMVNGTLYRDQHGAFAWRLSTWVKDDRPFAEYYRASNEEYWSSKGEFFEIAYLDYSTNPLAEGQWNIGKKVTEIDPFKELCLREAMSDWEQEELANSRN